MSFLAPWLLAALPLVALPIIIHLINQRRFQTIPWAAMMFLLSAQRMSRGYSRLRQWLIMLFRMLVIAGLVLAVSRPLASGWLGLVAGGKADTTLILLDRSPSMQERPAGGGPSKLETAREQIVRVLGNFGSGRWAVIDGFSPEPLEIESPPALLNMPTAGPASAPADLPLMLQAAHDYIQAQRAGRTEIWICSDLRANDWSADNGRWKALRDAFLQFPQGVRIHLLAYPQSPAGNVSVRVTSARRQVTRDGAELLVSVRVSRAADRERLELPLQFEIDGGRSVLPVELVGLQADVRDHRIPIEAKKQRGFGRVSIPADANAADNEFFFVFDDPPPRRTVVVADDQQAALPLQLAAAIAPEETLASSADVHAAEDLASLAWDEISLVLWQAPLPTGPASDLVEAFVARGGQVIFFPPREPNTTDVFGGKWQAWNEEKSPIETWRGDADLLGRTQSGAALPVGQLEIHRHCELSGEFTNLAALRGGSPLLARVPTDRGGVYFCSTTPAPRDSTLATNGLVLYALVQRALSAGSAVLGRTRWLDAGNPVGEDPAAWQRESGSADSLSTEAAAHAGVYSTGEKLLAVNRPAAEDDAKVLADPVVAELFRGLDFARVDDRAGNSSSLIQEIWRVFLAIMLLAIVLEAALCLPKLGRSTTANPAAASALVTSGRAAA